MAMAGTPVIGESSIILITLFSIIPGGLRAIESNRKNKPHKVNHKPTNEIYTNKL